MRSLIVFMAIWSSVCVLTPARGASAADAVLSEISAALVAGQYEDALSVSGASLAEPGLSDLSRARILVVRGLAYQALGRNNDALVEFTQGLSIAALPSQERVRALFARGLSLDALGRLDDAVGEYSAVLKLTPGATYALNNRANVRRRQGRLEDAKRDYLAALNGTNPNPQYPCFGLGQIAEAQGDQVAARRYYEKALASSPGFALALERLEAMGAPVEGPAGLPVDTGLILLKPPKAVPAVAPRPRAGVPVPVAKPSSPRRPAPAASGHRQAPLRPAIVEDAVPPGALAQLGAWRSAQEARDGWSVMQERAGALLEGLTPLVVRAEIPGRGVYWRLQVAPTQPVAQFCGALTQSGFACIPVRN